MGTILVTLIIFVFMIQHQSSMRRLKKDRRMVIVFSIITIGLSLILFIPIPISYFVDFLNQTIGDWTHGWVK